MGNSKLEIENSKLKVAVLMRGIGGERDISIQSGCCVAQALKDAGLNVVSSDIGPDNLEILENNSIDVFFIALHGRFGEDGQLQQILEDRGLIYTGSDPKGCRLAFDKLASKRHFIGANLTTPKFILFNINTNLEELEKQLSQLADRFVVKPVSQGSTIGITLADNPESALIAAQKCFNEFGDCMIEEFIPGREITVGIVENQSLPIIEIRTKTGFYDYQAKYIDESTEFLFDTIEPTLAEKIKANALTSFNVLGLRHFARIDFILSKDQKAYVLEANAIPGLTTHSLLPKAAARVGISMSQLCLRIIESAYSSLVKR